MTKNELLNWIKSAFLVDVSFSVDDTNIQEKKIYKKNGNFFLVNFMNQNPMASYKNGKFVHDYFELTPVRQTTETITRNVYFNMSTGGMAAIGRETSSNLEDENVYNEEISEIKDFDEDNVMSIKSFEECCSFNIFTDDNGFGHPVRNNKMASKIFISSSNLTTIPIDATHMIWFKK